MKTVTTDVKRLLIFLCQALQINSGAFSLGRLLYGVSNPVQPFFVVCFMTHSASKEDSMAEYIKSIICIHFDIQSEVLLQQLVT